jgi:hypothetical protein
MPGAPSICHPLRARLAPLIGRFDTVFQLRFNESLLERTRLWLDLAINAGVFAIDVAFSQSN